MLYKLPVSTLADSSKLSKSYIYQVRSGQRPPSQKLLKALQQYNGGNVKKIEDAGKAIDLFIKSRRNGISPNTIAFYVKYLRKSIPALGLSPTPKQLNHYFGSLSCSQGGKHAYYRAISVFYNWLYSPKSGLRMYEGKNPIGLIEAPQRPKLILPSLTREQVRILIAKSECVRDKAIISVFVESGLRLSELANIVLRDIDWESRIIRVLGKGNKEGYAPFGEKAEYYLSLWLNEYKPRTDQRIWNIGYWGIKTVLDDLKQVTGLPCNPHTFRRTFACLLRKAGVDTMTIKDLGRWESVEMVQRYTRSVTFHDSLKFYKAPLS